MMYTHFTLFHGSTLFISSHKIHNFFSLLVRWTYKNSIYNYLNVPIMYEFKNIITIFDFIRFILCK